LCNLWFFAFLAPVWEKSPIFEAEGFLRSKFYFVGCRFLSSRERPLDVRRAM